MQRRERRQRVKTLPVPAELNVEPMSQYLLDTALPYTAARDGMLRNISYFSRSGDCAIGTFILVLARAGHVISMCDILMRHGLTYPHIPGTSSTISGKAFKIMIASIS